MSAGANSDPGRKFVEQACPNCQATIPRPIANCPKCGYRFPPPASDTGARIGCLLVAGAAIFGLLTWSGCFNGSEDEAVTGSSVPQTTSSKNAELVATAINLSGNLCAQAIDVKPLASGGGNVFHVTCVEYRGGTATVRYRVDLRTDPPAIGRLIGDAPAEVRE